jgi:hypothetical protein
MSMKDNAPQVTMDELAIMIAKGFTGVDKRLDRLEGRMDSLEGKFDSFERKVDDMDSRLTNQLDYVLLHYARREEHVQLDKRVKKIERKVFV